MRVLALAFTGLFAIGCGEVAVVDDIDINLNVKDADLNQQGVFLTEKNINTEQGNPYGAFLGQVQEELGDKLGAINLNAATLTLQAGGTQAAFEQIYTGEVQLLVEGVPIATITDPTGTSVEMDVIAESFEDEAFQAVLNAGQFDVQLQGASAAGGNAVNVNVVSTLSFEATE